MNVLVACESSGEVRRAFVEAGHNAFSCDILPADDGEQVRHFQTHARKVIVVPGWDLLIAHPPCTRLCNSGVRWLAERNLWGEMREAAELFKAFLDAPIPRIAVENPRMHKYAVEIIGRRQDQTIQPWQFGHGETKATGLWLKNLPPLEPTSVVEGREQRIWKLPPGPDRWKQRSKTFTGIARAMAQQWGALGALEAP